MSRTARIEVPGIPVHVIQRGGSRCAIIADDDDRHHHRHLLGKACNKHGVAVQAFVLMDNHVHLLLSAPQPGALSRAMHLTGQYLAQAFNARHGRTGTLWQGRFKSHLVESERYLLTVLRCIELDPLRAATVATPEAHRWSSAHTHLGSAHDPLITPHRCYLALGAHRAERAAAYRQWLCAGIDDATLVAIRTHIAQQRVLGDTRFQRMVEEAVNRPAGCRARGRPRSAPEN